LALQPGAEQQLVVPVLLLAVFQQCSTASWLTQPNQNGVSQHHHQYWKDCIGLLHSCILALLHMQFNITTSITAVAVCLPFLDYVLAA
jgi:hypothetical protein